MIPSQKTKSTKKRRANKVQKGKNIPHTLVGTIKTSAVFMILGFDL